MGRAEPDAVEPGGHSFRSGIFCRAPSGIFCRVRDWPGGTQRVPGGRITGPGAGRVGRTRGGKVGKRNRRPVEGC